MHNQREMLIQKAIKDLEAAKTLASSGEDLSYIVCFHIQQYVDKMVKARLIELDIDYDQRHDIFYLLSLLPDKSICKKYEIEAYTLTHYAVVTRYGYIDPTENEMHDAFEMAERIVSAL